MVGEGLEDDGSVNVGFTDEESRERVGYQYDVLTMLEAPCGHDAVAPYAVVVEAVGDDGDFFCIEASQGGEEVVLVEDARFEEEVASIEVETVINSIKIRRLY